MKVVIGSWYSRAVAAGVNKGNMDDWNSVPDCRVVELDPPRQRKRKPSVSTLIARAEKKGKTVTSVTAPDGTVLHFGEPQPTEAANPWLAGIDKVTKQ